MERYRLSPPSNTSKRTPPYGFLVKDATETNAIKGKLWVADSRENVGVDLNYEVVVLGYKRDNTPEPGIISFNTYTVDIDSSIEWYRDPNNTAANKRNRVYVTEVISNSKIDPFTFRGGSKIHFIIGNTNTNREATLRVS